MLCESGQQFVTMNMSVALFSGLSRAAGRSLRTGTLKSGRALAVGLRRPFSTVLGVLPGVPTSGCTVSCSKCTNSPCLCVGLPWTPGSSSDDSCQELLSVIRTSYKFSSIQRNERTSTESLTEAVRSSVAIPTVLAVVRLYALAQRIDLDVQAKHESLSQVSRSQTLRGLHHCMSSRLQAPAMQLSSMLARLSLVQLNAFTRQRLIRRHTGE